MSAVKDGFNKNSPSRSRSARYTGENHKNPENARQDEVGFTDKLLMLAAAGQILAPILGALIGAVVVAWLLFRLFFGS